MIETRDSVVINKIFPNNEYKRASALVHITVYKSGLVEVEFIACNNRFFRKAFVSANLNITFSYGDIDSIKGVETLDESTNVTLIHDQFDMVKLLPKAYRIFRHDNASRGYFQEKRTYNIDFEQFYTHNDTDLEMDPQLVELSDRINNLGNDVRNARTMHGEDSAEYNDVVNQLVQAKDARDALSLSIQSEKTIRNIRVRAEVNVDI